ncbi:MAG: 3-hydroxyacyl-CoA dehydrogenase family protein [Nitrospirae bacterium]|nr:3-hydroxyacyl-CoA dehydrogenase family protein [Nitrospirota bacterium]
MNTIGVIGAGVMGVGVAQNAAQTGKKVVLIDLDTVTLEKAVDKIRQDLRFQSMFKPASANVLESTAVLNNITPSTDYSLLSSADYIIENVTEKWDLKKEVYQKIENLAKDNCIFAANTSAIPITRIASLTKRPDKVIGIHFMNPVPLKPAVEVIMGYHTTETTLNITKNLLSSMGKESIVVNDSPGFVSNRVLMLTINEAIYLVHENVAKPEDVDRIFKTCFGHQMGPLETADLIGLDTILYSIDVLYESFNDSKYRPCPLLKKMVDAGLYGMKNGKGFYTYDDF